MTGHPNLIHWDDVDSYTADNGELRNTARRLGVAAGCRTVGLRRFDVPPGGRTTPAHVHADEEEFFYVLAGTGLSWQDGKTYEVSPGDCLLHRRNAEAHTMIAGDGGMSVLAFADNSVNGTNFTYLPHAGVYWAGARWIPAAGPNPYKADVAAGPLPMPDAPEAERPPTIKHHSEVQMGTDELPGYLQRWWQFRPALGAATSGLTLCELEPGQLSCPPHWHTGEEEIFVVLEGEGTAWLDDLRLPVRPGSVLARPAGSGVAHSIEAGEGGMTFLGYGQHLPNDPCYYPRSKKFNIGGITFRVEPVDYWDGE